MAARKKLEPPEILSAALEIAEETGWASLRMTELAARLGLSWAELHAHFKDQNAIADAWFAQALKAMLAPVDENFSGLSAQERTYVIMMRWFDALAAHRRVTVQMLRGKIHPPHAHHWAPMVFSLSELVQWIREAAHLDAQGRRRQMEEIGHTALFLAALAVWSRDSSEGQTRTRQFLKRSLARADRFRVRRYRTAGTV